MKMTDEEIEALAEEALNAAALITQDRLGVTDGGFAGIFFSDGKVERIFQTYIRSELAQSEEQP
jgi:hypothetical protein